MGISRCPPKGKRGRCADDEADWQRHKELARPGRPLRPDRRLLTLLVAGGYWICATAFGVEPMLAVTLNFLVFTGAGLCPAQPVQLSRPWRARQCRAAAPAASSPSTSIGFLTQPVLHLAPGQAAGRPGLVAGHPDRVRDPDRHLLAQPPVGVRLMERERLRPDGASSTRSIGGTVARRDILAT